VEEPRVAAYFDETTLADIAGNDPCVFAAALLLPSPLRGGVGGAGQRALSLISSAIAPIAIFDLLVARASARKNMSLAVAIKLERGARSTPTPDPSPQGGGERKARVSQLLTKQPGRYCRERSLGFFAGAEARAAAT